MQLEYEGQSESLEFSPPKQRQQVLTLRNTSDAAVLFKVQCTAPHKLRVRPALGVLAASSTISIQVQLSPQECTASTCKLLLVGRTTTHANSSAAAVTMEQLKASWKTAEAQTNTLVLSETVNMQIRSASVDDNKAATLPGTPPERTEPFPKLTTTEIADLVLLLMKSQSRKKENALTPTDRDRMAAARELYPCDWPYWEEYAARMRKLLRERSKRKTHGTP